MRARRGVRKAWLGGLGGALLALAFVSLLALATPPAQAQPLSLEQVAPAGAKISTRDDMLFRVEYLERDKAWVREVIARADAARRVVNNATPDALKVRIHIILTPDRETFMRLVGRWAENAAAVAVSDTRQVVINGDALRMGAAGTLATTLIHELTHIYLGVRCQHPLPRWLNEGIAMSVAGEWSLEDSASVMIAATLGHLLPLSEIEKSFPQKADPQRLAYLQSHSVVSYLARQTPENNIAGVIRPLIGPEGVRQIELYWTPSYRDELEKKWRQSLRTSWNWTVIALSSGLLWGFLALLTFIAWMVRRRRSKTLHEEWDDEEQIYAALDEEEERIWGKEVEPENENETETEEDEEPWRQRF